MLLWGDENVREEGGRDTRRKEGRRQEFKSFLLAFLALLAPASVTVVL
jgi:hypothetical protein